MKKGIDLLIGSVSAASIVAKVARDQFMEEQAAFTLITVLKRMSGMAPPSIVLQLRSMALPTTSS